MWKLTRVFSFFGILILLPAVMFADTSKSKKPQLAKAQGREVHTCRTAGQELARLFLTVPAQPVFKLPPNWAEAGRVEFDFDGDGKMDAAMLLQRTFSPVYDDEEIFKESISKPVESVQTEKRVPAFLAVWASNRGAPKILVSKVATFSEATTNFLVDVGISMAKTGGNVLTTSEQTMMSMGGWTATSTTKKWRYENGDFRLIGRTVLSIQRNSGESEETDENLVTGKTVVTTEKRVDPEDRSEDPPMKKSSTSKKGSPKTIVLSSEGSCDDTPVWMAL